MKLFVQDDIQYQMDFYCHGQCDAIVTVFTIDGRYKIAEVNIVDGAQLFKIKHYNKNGCVSYSTIPWYEYTNSGSMARKLVKDSVVDW